MILLCGLLLKNVMCLLQFLIMYEDIQLLVVRTCRFDVETKITGFGSPEWEKTHEKATKTAAVLETLKQGGATCIGKTVMDELGFRYGCFKLSCSS